MKHLTTHFCNVMTPRHHLHFGIVGGGLLDDDVYIEMICDGIHLCDQMIRLIARIKSPTGASTWVSTTTTGIRLPSR